MKKRKQIKNRRRVKNDNYPSIYYHVYYFYLVNFLVPETKKPDCIHMLLH